MFKCHHCKNNLCWYGQNRAPNRNHRKSPHTMHTNRTNKIFYLNTHTHNIQYTCHIDTYNQGRKVGTCPFSFCFSLSLSHSHTLIYAYEYQFYQYHKIPIRTNNSIPIHTTSEYGREKERKKMYIYIYIYRVYKCARINIMLYIII